MHIHKFKEINLFNIVLFLLALLQYYFLARLNIPDNKYLPTIIDYDHRFGLIPAFIIPYISVGILFLFLLVFIWLKREGNDMTIFLFSVILLWSLINFAHGLLPTINVIRPEIKDNGFFFNSVNLLYQSVNPYRTLPSWTAATAILCAIAFFKIKFKFRKYVIIWVILICISPLFLRMAYILDIFAAIPLPFICYFVSEKLWNLKIKKETIQEIVRVFTLESLIQSIAVGIRDDNTISSLIEGLTRIEKNLTERDKEEIKEIGSKLNPPVESLKEVINNLNLSIRAESHIEKAREMFGKEKSYLPSSNELKQASSEIINCSCKAFDNSEFRNLVLEIKKRNTELMNTSSIEEAAKERSKDIIFRFNSFIDSNQKNIPALKSIYNNTNGHSRLSSKEISFITRELRKPPYEISTNEIWNAYYRINSKNVKPLGEQKNPANIIPLTQFAIGKIDSLEPFEDNVDKKFNEWLIDHKANGRIFQEEELEWLEMMKNYIAFHLEIHMTSFNEPPFVNKGGATKAFNIFGPDLNRILHEFNDIFI